MNIYNPNGTVLIENIPVTESAVRVQELMKSDYVTLTWSDVENIVLPVGAYIIPFPELDKDGNVIGGERYILFAEYKATQRNEVEYVYTPEFMHPKMILGCTPCLFKTGDSYYDSDWTTTGTLQNVVEGLRMIIKQQLNIEFAVQFLLNDATDEIPASATCTFSSVDILSAFAEVCNQFKCEYHIDWGNAMIYVGVLNRNIHGTPAQLVVGGNIGVPSVNKGENNVGNVYYVSGGTRNITTSTTTGENVETHRRLTLNADGSSIIDKRASQDEPKVVRMLTFDNVYPHIDLYVYNVRYRERRLYDADKKPVVDHYDAKGNPVYKTYRIYYIRLAHKVGEQWRDYTIDPSTDIVNGKTLSASFEPNEGKGHSALAGREFELMYHKVAQTIPEVKDDKGVVDGGVQILANDYEIKFEQNDTLIIPNEYLAPWGEKTPSLNGDKVVLFNVVMTEEYLEAARVELREVAEKEIAKLMADSNTYTIKSRPHAFDKVLAIGENVDIVETDGSVRNTRVQKITTHLDVPTDVEIVVGSAVLKGVTETLREDVKALHLSFGTNTTMLQNNSSLMQSILRSIQDVDNAALRKDRDDETPYTLTMRSLKVKEDSQLNDATFGIFNKGIQGGIIEKNGNSELNSLVLRESLTVPELHYQRVEVETGTIWHTVGGGKIESVEVDYDGHGGNITLRLLDGEIGAIAVGDLCQGIFHMSDGDNNTQDIDGWVDSEGKNHPNGNFSFAGFKTVYFRIDEIYDEGRNSQFHYTLRAYDESVEGDEWSDDTHPQPQMSFAQYANKTYGSRQQCGYEMKDYEIMLTGMTKWTYGSSNIQYIKGNLNGFSIDCKKWVNGEYIDSTIELQGWGIAYGNAYQWGTIRQFDRNRSLVSQQLYFLANNSTTPPSVTDSGWSRTPLSPDSEHIYVWQYWEYTYSDGAVEKSDVFQGSKYAKDAPGRNLVDKSNPFIKFNTYGTGLGLKACMPVMAGETYTLSANGRVDDTTFAQGNDVLRVYAFIQEGGTWLWNVAFEIRSTDNITKSRTFTINDAKLQSGKEYELRIEAYYYYNFNGTGDHNYYNKYGKYPNGYVYLNWVKFEEGSVATPWCLSENDKKGEKGDDGKSAYEIAVEEGFSGTEEEWLESLIGKSGKSVVAIKEEYAIGNDPSSYESPTLSGGWSESIKQPTESHPYLWNRETSYSDRSMHDVIARTTPVIISKFSKDGRGISSVSEEYIAKDVKTPPSSSTSGNTTIPSYFGKNKPYLYNREKINYTDGKSSPWTAWQLISYYGQDGNDGADGADGVQPNLFGYDSEILGGNRVESTIHTSVGIAAYCSNTATTATHWVIFIANILETGRKYAISFKVKSPVSGTLYVNFHGKNIITTDVTKDQEVFVEGKGVCGNTDSDGIRIQLSPSVAQAYNGLIVISDLKVEDGTKIIGTSTPFNGLAPDSVPQGVNMLTRCHDFGDWTTDSKVTKTNKYQGNVALYYAGGSSDSGKWLEITSKNISLTGSRWYTFSFMAKGNAQIQTQISGLSSSGMTNVSPMACDGDGAFLKKSGEKHMVNHTLSQNQWVHHSMTFLAPESFTAKIQIYIFNTDNVSGKNVYIAMPKLEEGQKATDWSVAESDKVGAQIRPRGVYSPTETYVYDSEYRDVVEYDASGGTNYKHYVVRDGVSSVKGQAPSASSQYWKEANEFQFIATDLLLTQTMYTRVMTAVNAKIEELIVQNLKTATTGARTEISAGVFNIFGTTGDNPMISIEVDDTGAPHLVFFNQNGDRLYDLGPSGISNITKVDSSFSNTEKLSTVLTGTNLRISNLNNIKGGTFTSLFKFIEGYTLSNGRKIYITTGTEQPSSEHNKTYLTSTTRVTGTEWLPAGEAATGIRAKQSIQVGIASDNQPIWQTVVYVYSGGVIVNQVTVNWSVHSTTVWIHTSGASFARASKTATGGTILQTTSIMDCDQSRVKV